MTTVNSHLDKIKITIVLAALAQQVAGFGTTMLVVDQATNTLDGDRVRTYTSSTDADTDFAAGFISSVTRDTIKTGFAQNPAPAVIKVGRIDTVGAETYSTGYTAIKAADDDFYGVVIDKRSVAEQLLISADIESENRVLIIQSSDAGWKTTGIPAAYSALTGRERTVVVYHDTDATQQDMASAARWLAFSPDEQSAPYEGALKSVLALASLLTSGEKAFLEANFANYALPLGGEPFYLMLGVNISGRPLYEILTADWFSARLQERIAALRVAKSVRGEKIPVTTEGQGMVVAEIDGLAIVATAGVSPHLVLGQTRTTALAITQADRDNGELRFRFEGQIASNANKFDVTVFFQRSPLAAAA
jgi:hypothetical protein